ncbi:MAG: RimJ/RimL family protein N-acetyltransferase [Parasphingorhabdus sp.]
MAIFYKPKLLHTANLTLNQIKIMTEKLEIPFPRELNGDPVQHQPGGLIPARKTLTGQVVSLRPLAPETDAQALFECAHGSDDALRIWDYLAYGPWKNIQDHTHFLRQQAASFDPIFYTIYSNEDNRPCGVASFLDIHPQNGVIEIGHIWFSPALQRTRGATEALFLMLDYAMTDLSYRRMQWRCNSLNERSRAAARRLGFRFEGIFYNHLIFKGHNRDTAWYSILNDEWPEVRELISNWLQSENFDQQGNAQISLSAGMQNRLPGGRVI